MVTGWPPAIDSTHAASHGAGHSRPVNSGKLLVACRASIAKSQLPVRLAQPPASVDSTFTLKPSCSSACLVYSPSRSHVEPYGKLSWRIV